MVAPASAALSAVSFVSPFGADAAALRLVAHSIVREGARRTRHEAVRLARRRASAARTGLAAGLWFEVARDAAHAHAADLLGVAQGDAAATPAVGILRAVLLAEPAPARVASRAFDLRVAHCTWLPHGLDVERAADARSRSANCEQCTMRSGLASTWVDEVAARAVDAGFARAIHSVAPSGAAPRAPSGLVAATVDLATLRGRHAVVASALVEVRAARPCAARSLGRELTAAQATEAAIARARATRFALVRLGTARVALALDVRFHLRCAAVRYDDAQAIESGSDLARDRAGARECEHPPHS